MFFLGIWCRTFDILVSVGSPCLIYHIRSDKKRKNNEFAETPKRPLEIEVTRNIRGKDEKKSVIGCSNCNVSATVVFSK